MNLKLIRHEFRVDGIFGDLYDDKGNTIIFTLEHVYDVLLDKKYVYAPKLPDGVYQCVRGYHKLEGMMSAFETFEITGVPGHTGILFHQGNYNRDSTGCVLLGLGQGGALPSGKMLVRSRDAFNAFMLLQKDCDSFELTVESIV